MDSTLVRQVILFHHLDELRRKDPDLDKFFNLFRLKTHHPSLFRLASNLKTIHSEPSLDLKSICQSLESSLNNELIEVGKYVCDKEAPDIETIKNDVDLFLSEARAIDHLDRESNNLRVQIAKAAEDYFKYSKKHTEEFKINFKLAHDHSTANLLYAKAYAICLKRRLRETERAVDKFGKASIISELRRKRDGLESKNKILKQELREKQDRLKQYDEMDPDLMKKYHSLKEELNYRIWACKQADQGSNSSSGSIEFS